MSNHSQLTRTMLHLMGIDQLDMVINEWGVNGTTVPSGISHLPSFQQDRWMDRVSILESMANAMDEGITISGWLFSDHWRAGGYSGDEASKAKVDEAKDKLGLDLKMTRTWWHTRIGDDGKATGWIQNLDPQSNIGLVTVPSRTTGRVRVFACMAEFEPDSGWYTFSQRQALMVAQCDTLDEAEELVYGRNSFRSAWKSCQMIERAGAERVDRTNLREAELDDALDF